MNYSYLSIRVTDKCNYSCKHCGVYSLGDPVDVDLKLLIQYLDGLNACLPLLREVHVTGGEALLHPRIGELLSYLKYHKYNIILYTNGSLIGDYFDLVTEYCHTIRISLESHMESDNDFIRGRGAFSKTLSGVGRLRDSRVLRHLAVTITKHLNDIEGLVDFAIDNKFDILSFQALAENKRIVSSGLGISYERALSVIDEINKLRTRVGEKLTIEKVDLNSVCSIKNDITRIAIHNDGVVTPCQFITNEDYSFGNIEFDEFDGNRIEDVILKIQSRWTRHNTACEKCVVSKICNRGCPAIGINAMGDVSCEDDNCNMRIKKWLDTFNVKRQEAFRIDKL